MAFFGCYAPGLPGPTLQNATRLTRRVTDVFQLIRGVLEALALSLKIRGRLDVQEAFIDGSFTPAKKGEPKSARRSAAREAISWQSQIAMGFPLLCTSKALRLMK